MAHFQNLNTLNHPPQKKEGIKKKHWTEKKGERDRQTPTCIPPTNTWQRKNFPFQKEIGWPNEGNISSNSNGRNVMQLTFMHCAFPSALIVSVLLAYYWGISDLGRAPRCRWMESGQWRGKDRASLCKCCFCCCRPAGRVLDMFCAKGLLIFCFVLFLLLRCFYFFPLSFAFLFLFQSMVSAELYKVVVMAQHGLNMFWNGRFLFFSSHYRTLQRRKGVEYILDLFWPKG